MRVSETTFVISDDTHHAGYNTYQLYRTGSTVVYPYSEYLPNSMSYRTYVHFPGTPVTCIFRLRTTFAQRCCHRRLFYPSKTIMFPFPY
jgi:hypothetical protein